MQDNEEQITFFAKTNFRNREVPFGIKTDDRRRHMYIIGKTGMGKTTLMENMAIQDIRNGHGVCFIDAHGDSVAKILDFVPPSRVNDVIYFNPADQDYPIAFNVMESVGPQFKHLVADGLMGVFTKIWANMWSSRMEYILSNTVRALLDNPGTTVLGITRMYLDKNYRKRIVDNIQDPMVKLFWTEEYANYDQKYVKEAVAPIQNKVGQFLSSSIIRNIVGQPKSTIDIRKIMDERKVLLVDISKGKVGEDNSALLGAMLVTKLQMAALSRADIPNEADRSDFYLYVDEFQNFATESFATILSEARKYHLNLIMGHQYIGQLTPEKSNTRLRDAIFGNVGSIVCFRVGAADAEFLATEFAPIYTPNDLVNLPKWEIILKLMINGIASEPFSAQSIPVNPSFRTGNAEKVIRVSRERFANSKDVVEDKISRWMGGAEPNPAQVSPEPSSTSKESDFKAESENFMAPEADQSAVPEFKPLLTNLDLVDSGPATHVDKQVFANPPAPISNRNEASAFKASPPKQDGFTQQKFTTVNTGVRKNKKKKKRGSQTANASQNTSVWDKIHGAGPSNTLVDTPTNTGNLEDLLTKGIEEAFAGTKSAQTVLDNTLNTSPKPPGNASTQAKGLEEPPESLPGKSLDPGQTQFL